MQRTIRWWRIWREFRARLRRMTRDRNLRPFQRRFPAPNGLRGGKEGEQMFDTVLTRFKKNAAATRWELRAPERENRRGET